MECVQNLLLGDPVYDERGQLVRREYGLKNALALFVLGYIAYTLYCSMGKKVFSGKRKGKMKGGGSSGSGSQSSKGHVKNKKAKQVLFRILFSIFIVLGILIIIFAASAPKKFKKYLGDWPLYIFLVVFIILSVWGIVNQHRDNLKLKKN